MLTSSTGVIDVMHRKSSVLEKNHARDVAELVMLHRVVMYTVIAKSESTKGNQGTCQFISSDGDH